MARHPELEAFVEVWQGHDSARLFDLENGPLAAVADDLVVVELTDDGHFRYTHYGANVMKAGGLDMLGKRTDQFETGIGAFFARSYHEALIHQEPILAINKAKMTHVTHSWVRLLLPIAGVTDGEPDRVIAMVRPLTYVSDVLADFTRDIGFLGGTLEPILEDDMVVDFILMTVSHVSELFGDQHFETLSDLMARPLTFDEIDKILTATDGVTAINRELPASMDRFGRSLVLKVNGGNVQPLFSLTDSTELLAAHNKAEERKVAMESFADIASDWLWETDSDQVITMMSPAIKHVTGMPHTSYIGTSRMDLIGAPANADVLGDHKADLKAHRPFRGFVYQVTLPGGRVMWARANGDPLFGKDGTFLGYRGTCSNITDEVEAREQAARRAAELAEAHRIGRLGTWRYDRVTGVAVFSPELYELIGLPRETVGLPREDLRAMYTPESRERIDQSHQKVIETGKSDQIDVQLTCVDGTLIDLSMITRLENTGDHQGQLFGTVQDITDRKKAERDLEALAFFDPLTGLGNRSYFGRELKESFVRVATSETMAGLLLLDLDHFKEVNDSLGHGAGDALLRRAADLLVRAAGHGAVVCRLGGDEFAIIIPQINTAAELGVIAGTVNAAFAQPITLSYGVVHITTSIGMVMIPSQSVEAQEAMRFADLALYEAKSAGRNQAVLFHSKLDESVQQRVNLARDLRKAIEQNELETHFQLQVDVMSGRVAGFEALMRWKHPERGYVPPSEFIPIAESSRLISDIGCWIVHDVCRQGKAWLDAGGAPLPLSVNVSVAQLWHTDVAAEVLHALDQTGFPPELLWVELTESVFSDEAMPRIERLFDDLRAAGVRIALDDFGTGYSSLRYLNALNFDSLKIDRSFVTGSDVNTEKRRLLQGIVGLAKGLGMGIVVEGVETEKELQTVCDLGCDVVQGFFFARPKPFHEACLDAVQVEADYALQPVMWKSEDESAVAKWANKWRQKRSA